MPLLARGTEIVVGVWEDIHIDSNTVLANSLYEK